MSTFQETFNPNVTILAVDDSKFILAFIRQNLEQMYNIITACSAEEGYAVMEQSVPDLILLDLEMPDINGYGFLEHVKSIEQYKDISVVLLTGRIDNETEEKAFALGATDYLVKPITEKLLKLRVNLHVDQILRRKNLEEAATANSNLKALRLDTTAEMRLGQVNREYMPYGSVLIVDDAETNLYVAKSLLTPYGINVETVNSGYLALDRITSGKKYDIIFMDHMMPGMDGIETTKKIRDMGYTAPIAALTANTVAGQKEHFLENGFDDFISKPIDTRQLNLILNKFVRGVHKENNTETYQQFLESPEPQAPTPCINESPETGKAPLTELEQFFLRDAVKTLKILREAHELGYPEAEIKDYITSVHGIKSALGNFGEKDASNDAANLENAGRSGDIAFIKEHTVPFIQALEKIVDSLTLKNSANRETSGADANKHHDKAFMNDKLTIIANACEQFDVKSARAAIKELRTKTWDAAVDEKISEISKFLLTSDFESISPLLDELMS